MHHLIVLFFTMLFSTCSLTAFASTSTPRWDYATEFKAIEKRFEKVKPLIKEITGRHNVHSGLMTTLIYKESRFDARAINMKGSSARGLVQMTVGTKRSMLRLYGKQLGLAPNADIFDPVVAIKLGTVYLNHVEGELEKRLNRPMENAEIYLGYKYGPAGAARLLKKKNKLAKAELRKYRRDEAFYGKLIKPEPVVDMAQVRAELNSKVDEVRKIWSTLYGVPFIRSIT
ncbi:MAG: transglycosylase SLT domain-containing protein [Shewanella sp.]